MSKFKILAKDGNARRGVVTTLHGEINTPAFMPVGTAATVKGVFTDDIIKTVGELRYRGIEFLSAPPQAYYDDIPNRLGDHMKIMKEDIGELQKLAIMIDADEEGYLLQIFTKPVEDRPTLFFEIIQRMGARGFGAGNFKALFESIEREQANRGTL